MGELFGKLQVGIVVVAYNAEDTLASVLDRIPSEIASELATILVCDDASLDKTHDEALAYQGMHNELPLSIVRHPLNLGYGGNQKFGYKWAFELGLDFVVLLHGDGQYAPEAMLDLLVPLLNGSADAVFGSRMMHKGAARAGGMPMYKYAGNKILTKYENAMTGMKLSEWHSGYRAYRLSTLQKLPLNSYSDGFDFDTQIILGLINCHARIVEVPIPTYYGDEICYVDGMKYAKDLFVHSTKYRIRKMGFGMPSKVDGSAAYELKGDSLSSHGRLLKYVAQFSEGEVLDLGCSDGLLSSRIRSFGLKVTGVDFEAHPQIHGHVDRFVQANLDFGLPEDLPSKFDLVICADVLEHVRQPELLLKQLSTRLKSGGAVLVSIPNFGHWYPRLRTFLGAFDYDRRGILDATHVRFYTRRSFEKLARGAGFEINRIGATGLPFEVVDRGGKGGLSTKFRWLRQIDQYLVKIRPQVFAYQFLFELKNE